MLVPELAHAVTITLHAAGDPPLVAKPCLTSALQGVPSGARLLKGVDGATSSGSAGDKVSFGVCRSEAQFVTFAKHLDRPLPSLMACSGFWRPSSCSPVGYYAWAFENLDEVAVLGCRAGGCRVQARGPLSKDNWLDPPAKLGSKSFPRKLQC